MWPIDTADKVFHDGNGSDIQGTILPAEWLNNVQAELINVITGQGIELDKDKQTQLLEAIKLANSKSISFLTRDDDLPASNIGPIWHEKYASIMTWVVYDANGASYSGYASVDIGIVTAESQPQLRPGYIRSGAASYNQATYPILWNWAKHNGLVQNTAIWKAKTGFYRDNGDGTFTPPDLTDQHIRFSGTAREVGSHQGDAMRPIKGGAGGAIQMQINGPFGQLADEWRLSKENNTAIGYIAKLTYFDISRVVPVAPEVRVVTTAFLPAIKH